MNEKTEKVEVEPTPIHVRLAELSLGAHHLREAARNLLREVESMGETVNVLVAREYLNAAIEQLESTSQRLLTMSNEHRVKIVGTPHPSDFFRNY